MILPIFLIYLCSGMWLTNSVKPPSLPPEPPVQWSLAVKPKAHQAGEKFTARLTAQIAKGWHLYGLEEIPNGPRPTRITLAVGQPFRLLGDLKRPQPITQYDENFGVETQFYKTSATFQLPLRINSSAKPGTAWLIVQARYQVCNEQMCLPPKTVTVQTTIKIK